MSDEGFVGQFALALGEELVAAHGVPIALVNGAEGGTVSPGTDARISANIRCRAARYRLTRESGSS